MITLRIIAPIWYHLKYYHFQKFYLSDKEIVEGSFFEIQSFKKID